MAAHLLAVAIEPPHFVPQEALERFKGERADLLSVERANGGRRRSGSSSALAARTPASAHPHVWITVKSQIAFTPDGKVSAVVHDWVFDEMYSSFATQGLANPGELVKRAQFAPLAQENAGSLADIGYFTTLKIGGKSVEFGSVTDYWMEERPDHLVEFHVTLPLKTPTPAVEVPHLARRRPRVFHRFRIRRQGSGEASLAPAGCSASVAKPKPLEDGRQAETDRIVLHQSVARDQFRLQNGERRHHRVPMIKRAASSRSASAFGLRSVAAALAQIAHAAVCRRRRRGRRRGGRRRRRLADGRAVASHPSHGGQGPCTARRPGRRLGTDRARPGLRRLSRRRARPRQSGDRLLHAGQRALAQARRLACRCWRRCCRRGRDRSRRGGGYRLQRHRLRDEPRRQLDRARQLLWRRRHRPLARLAQGRRARRGVAPPFRARPRRYPPRPLSPASSGARRCWRCRRAIPRRGARRRRAGRRLRPAHALDPGRSTARFPGATPPER